MTIWVQSLLRLCNYHSKLVVKWPRLRSFQTDGFQTKNVRLRMLESYSEFAYVTDIAKNSRIPALGMTFDVSYIDTRPDNRPSDAPTVVIVHDVPGSHEDYAHITSFLHAKGARVVVPNFPGLNWTKMDADDEFHHSCLEKSVFLMDLLEFLRISRVDMIIGHSIGANPAIFMSSCERLFRSLVILNPPPIDIDRYLRPVLLSDLICWLSRLPGFLAAPLRNMGLLLLRLMLPVYGKTFPDLNTASVWLETHLRSDYENFKAHAMNVRLHRLPRMVVYDTSDTAVDFEETKVILDKFGIDPKNTISATNYSRQSDIDDGVACYVRGIELNGESSRVADQELVKMELWKMLETVAKQH